MLLAAIGDCVAESSCPLNGPAHHQRPALDQRAALLSLALRNALPALLLADSVSNAVGLGALAHGHHPSCRRLSLSALRPATVSWAYEPPPGADHPWTTEPPSGQHNFQSQSRRLFAQTIHQLPMAGPRLNLQLVESPLQCAASCRSNSADLKRSRLRA